MGYYTETILPTLAWKLKEKGMSIRTEGHSIWCPMYAEVFDWLMGKNIRIYVVKAVKCNQWHGMVNTNGLIYRDTWHEAANAAIEKALELIKEK